MKGVGGWHNQSSFAWVLLGLMLRLLEVPNCIPCKPAHVFILQRKRSCNFDTLKYEHLCVMQSVRLSASTCYVCLRELFLFSQSLAFEGKRCSPVGRLTELFRLSGRQRTPHSYFSAHFIFFFPPSFFNFLLCGYENGWRRKSGGVRLQKVLAPLPAAYSPLQAAVKSLQLPQKPLALFQAGKIIRHTTAEVLPSGKA